MDSAPLPSQHPPCDEDFKATFGEQAIIAEEQESDNYDEEAEEFSDPELNDIVKKSHQSTSLQQLGVLQRIVFEDATLRQQKPADLNQLVKAWDVLEERKRILRNRPLPGSLTQKTERKPSRPSPTIVLGADDLKLAG